MKNRNVLYAQSGGVTSVINATAAGVLEAGRKSKRIGKIFAAKNGILGALNEEIIDTSFESDKEISRLKHTPGGVFGSCRYKLQDPSSNQREYKRLLDVFVAHNIGYFFYNGGGDSQDTANKIANFTKNMGFPVQCIGIPKTVDNDIVPIAQSLGAATAAEQGALFFENIANENTTSARQLIIHEVMGRHCGWLTAATARDYRKRLQDREFYPELLISMDRWDVDAVYIPELPIDLEAESERLKRKMDEKDGVNIFLSEGAGIETIVNEMEAKDEEVPRDAFGHVRLDEINPGLWYAKQFSNRLEAQKVLVQKSGYFARSAAANPRDLTLIKRSATLAAECGLSGQNGVVGLDEDNNDELSLINFDRIKGGKPFNTDQSWFQDMLQEIN